MKDILITFGQNPKLAFIHLTARVQKKFNQEAH